MATKVQKVPRRIWLHTGREGGGKGVHLWEGLFTGSLKMSESEPYELSTKEKLLWQKPKIRCDLSTSG